MMKLSIVLVGALAMLGCKKDEPAPAPATAPAPTTPTAPTTPPAADPAPTAPPAGAAKIGSCDLTTKAGMCLELSPPPYDEEKEYCGTENGIWAEGPCPTANLLGVCTNPDKQANAKVLIYKSVAFSTAAEAQ